MMRGLMILIVVGMSVMVDAAQRTSGCAGHKCCPGKDNKCMVPGARMNNPSSSSCFCDESCVFTRDCCSDYKDVCKAVNCVLGPWAEWGECSTKCGWGQKKRIRHVQVAPKNGGNACEETDQKAFCYGWSCKSQRHSTGSLEARETGKIIPAKYGSHRKSKVYNPYADIRRNLFNYYSANNAITRPSYCARFEVTHAHHACFGQHAKDWSRLLKKGSEVCVECQPLAMKRKLGIRCKGHGVFHKETRWTAATVSGCAGKWIMRTEHENCSCNPEEGASFILL